MLLEAAGEGILGLDADGRTTFVNPAALAMTGFAAEELLGRPAHALLHHSHEDGRPYHLGQCPSFLALSEGSSRSVSDEVFWRKDGSNFPVEYTAAPSSCVSPRRRPSPPIAPRARSWPI